MAGRFRPGPRSADTRSKPSVMDYGELDVINETVEDLGASVFKRMKLVCCRSEK